MGAVFFLIDSVLTAVGSARCRTRENLRRWRGGLPCQI